ncbi:MAG: hypothetical protein ACYCXA_14640 [Actinomycetes bacterium]
MLRSDSGDLETYARVLSSSLAEALPVGMVTLERERSVRDRMSGRPGRVVTIRVDAGASLLELALGAGGRPAARVVSQVGGVVISRREVGLAEWTQALAEQLARLAAESSAAREALRRLLEG